MSEVSQIPTTMIGALRFRAERTPNKAAYLTGSDVWTCRRLLEESEQLARALRGLGIGCGDRVALHMTNVPELILAYYACFFLGAIAAPLHIRIKTAELHPLLLRLRPALYLGHAQLYPEVVDIEAETLPLNRRFVAGSEPVGAARPWQKLVDWGTPQEAKAADGAGRCARTRGAALHFRRNWSDEARGAYSGEPRRERGRLSRFRVDRERCRTARLPNGLREHLSLEGTVDCQRARRCQPGRTGH